MAETMENGESRVAYSGEDLCKDFQQMKHPLHNTWTLWYFEKDTRSRCWEDNLREITSFSTVEDFWSLYNHIKPASELRPNCDYCLFKQGIRPMWEDDANKNGGRWVVSIEKRNEDELDCMWLEILLCLVGEGFDEFTDEVCGAVVNVRNRAFKIAVWTSDANMRTNLMEIGRRLKSRLNIHQRNSMTYQSHKESVRSGGPNTPSMLTL